MAMNAPTLIDSRSINNEIIISGAIDSADDISITGEIQTTISDKNKLPFWNHFIAGGFIFKIIL